MTTFRILMPMLEVYFQTSMEQANIVARKSTQSVRD
jgi:hypothetical protein